MSNGKPLLATMKNLIGNKDKLVDQGFCNEMIITALIDLYEKMEQLHPMIGAYKISIFIFSALGLSLIGMVWGIFTGKIDLVFK